MTKIHVHDIHTVVCALKGRIRPSFEWQILPFGQQLILYIFLWGCPWVVHGNVFTIWGIYCSVAQKRQVFINSRTGLESRPRFVTCRGWKHISGCSRRGGGANWLVMQRVKYSPEWRKVTYGEATTLAASQAVPDRWCCSAKSKGGNCSLCKWAVIAFWLCRVEYNGLHRQLHTHTCVVGEKQHSTAVMRLATKTTFVTIGGHLVLHILLLSPRGLWLCVAGYIVLDVFRINTRVVLAGLWMSE